MLVVNRTAETLTPDERDLRDLIRAFPRTASRPTDQRSGELKGSSLETFSAPCIGDEGEDIAFSPVPHETDTPTIPQDPTPSLNTNPFRFAGVPTMHIKQFHQGTCLLHLFTTDLALLALVLRHATSNEYLQTLNPLMTTTLDSLASAFETGTLVALQQTGQVRVAGEATLTAEQVQAWCQRVVVEGLPGYPTATYTVDTSDRDTLPEG